MELGDIAEYSEIDEHARGAGEVGRSLGARSPDRVDPIGNPLLGRLSRLRREITNATIHR